MLEFGVEVTTNELVALERALRSLDTDAARAAIAKAHHHTVSPEPTEREAVLSALQLVLQQPPTTTQQPRQGLAHLATKLQRQQQTETTQPPPPARPRATRK